MHRTLMVTSGGVTVDDLPLKLEESEQQLWAKAQEALDDGQTHRLYPETYRRNIVAESKDGSGTKVSYTIIVSVVISVSD